MYSIKVRGLASEKIVKTLTLLSIPENISLMNFLLSQGIPIASSCKGEGVCSKCTVNNNLLSCQISLENFLERFPNHEISVSYL